MHTFFWGCWGLFIVLRSCLLSLQSKPPKLAEEATQACCTSLSGLLDKPFFLVEQVSRNVVGKSGPSSRLGAHAKGWALPSLGMCMWISWTRQWAYWGYRALFHNLSSSAAPFTPFDPSPSCRRSIGVTVKTDRGDGPSLWR